MTSYRPFSLDSLNNPYQQMEPVIAHRGASGEAPENTAAAIRLAAEQGAHWIEVDATISAEGVAVIFHDSELKRCSNGDGHVAQLRLSELKALDCGSWFSPQYRGENILTLAELLTLCNQLGLNLNLEVKPTIGRETETVWAIRTALQQVPFDNSLLLSSFNHHALKACQQHLPDIARALNVDAIPYNWQERLDEYQALGLHFSADFFDARLVQQLSEHGVPMACFTVNSPELAQTLWQAGVLSVFSDYPYRLIQTARKANQWHNH
ncbi:glycerophosphodiester phosphodiesterase family protein [Bacterioplanoides sp.]|uniref:glycerophosphodiester phosphodiesterase family protein n=1 Tax=Bacterioplanoides sp. TaxID=2066072 RepID=UPI003AFF7FE0